MDIFAEMKNLIEHRHAKTSRLVVRVELPDPIPRLTLVVETDLFLNSEHPKHDVAAYNDLVTAVKEYMERRTDIERATIEQMGTG